MNKALSLLPELSFDSHKGSNGRVGVVGGSETYAGAPYFAGMAAMRSGSDLVHILTQEAASIPIKCYSPDLIVHPLLYSSKTAHLPFKELFEPIKELLSRFDSLIIGPGLGRDPVIGQFVVEIIKEAKLFGIPLVIDADGLYFMNSNLALIEGYKSCILTPNIIEFGRLLKAAFGEDGIEVKKGIRRLGRYLHGPTILLKGKIDLVSDGSGLLEIDEMGSPRRVSGQGDILTGLCGTLICQNTEILDAATAAASLLKVASRLAYRENGLATITSDILAKLTTIIGGRSGQ